MWNICTLYMGMQNGAAIKKNHIKFPQKLQIELPYDPAIPCLGIYPKELKSISWWDIFTPMFITTLFIIAKIWNQLKSSWTDEWIKMWYIYIYIYIYIYNSNLPRRKFCSMWQHGWTLRALCKWNKPVSHKKTNTACFYLCEVSYIVKFLESKSEHFFFFLMFKLSHNCTHLTC